MKAEHEPFSASALTASLTVKELTASVAWYEHSVGFTVTNRYERGGKVVAVALKAGTDSSSRSPRPGDTPHGRA
jgi:hypothetical protein